MTRRRLAAVLAASALLVTGALVLRHFLRPQALTALLVAQARSRLGVELAIDGPARYGFWPRLHLDLPRVTLRTAAAATPIATAQRVEVVVPWSAAWRDVLAIERVRIVQPRLDLDALAAWQAARPAGAAPAFSLHLVVSDGTLVRGEAVVAEGVVLDATAGAALSRWLAQPGDRDPLAPVDGTADVRRLRLGESEVEDLHVEIAGDPPKREP
jgi:hypothetical protein